jgi:DNA-binding transcriptional regulator YdaS (Cro superfamily)
MAISEKYAQIESMLGRMTPQQRQQFAAMHKNSPDASIVIPMALAITQQEQQMRQAMQAQQAGQQGEPPKVVDQAIASMAPQQQQLPEDQGIATLPAENMQNMAYGGIAGYADGGFPQDIYSGDPEYGGPGMAGGGMVERYQVGGMPPNYDPNSVEAAIVRAQTDIAALTKEISRARDPEQRATLEAELKKTQSDLTQLTGGKPPSVAQRVTNALPVPAAQAATPQPAVKPVATQSALQPPVPGMTPEATTQLEELGQVVDRTRQAVKDWRKQPTGNLSEYRDLQRQAAEAQKAYEAFASTIPQLNTPAFAAPRKTAQGTPSRTNIGAQTPPTWEEAKRETESRNPPEISAADNEKRQEAFRAFRVSEIQEQNRLGELEKNLTKKQKEKVGKTAEDLHPDAGKKGWTKDDWILLGLGLMASKNRQFLGALGEAGMGVIAERRAQKKEEREDFYRRALATEALSKAGYWAGGGGRKSTGLKDIFSAVNSADNRAVKIAQKQWGDMAERNNLVKQGYKTFDDYLTAVRQNERKMILKGAVQGAAPVDEEDTDEET